MVLTDEPIAPRHDARVENSRTLLRSVRSPFAWMFAAIGICLTVVPYLPKTAGTDFIMTMFPFCLIVKRCGGGLFYLLGPAALMLGVSMMIPPVRTVHVYTCAACGKVVYKSFVAASRTEVGLSCRHCRQAFWDEDTEEQDAE